MKENFLPKEKKNLSLKYMQGNSLFFFLQPHILFMWASAVKFSHQLVSRAEQYVFRWLSGCGLCAKERFALSIAFPGSSISPSFWTSFGFLHLGEQIAGQRLLFSAVLGDYFCPLPRMLKIERVLQIRLLVLTYLNLHLSKAIPKVACSDSYTLFSFLLVLPVDFLFLKLCCLVFPKPFQTWQASSWKSDSKSSYSFVLLHAAGLAGFAFFFPQQLQL